jgi:dTDP-4-amino-4,6-dideoxygalactose transaminase
MHQRIPFNRPFIAGKEVDYITKAVTSGDIAGDGHFTKSCARLLEQRFDISNVLMTPSCTAALEMAAMLCRLGPGDEVILPSFTFVSTANAAVRLGAKPIFVDIRPDTLNINEALIKRAISPRTKAIFPVHYAGVSCNMEEIMALAKQYNLLVVEDAAQGVNAFYKGRALGSIGHLAAYSFHETKNYVCGEGGSLCINAPELMERAEIIRDKGTNRGLFMRGVVDKYTWVEVGSSYVPSEICSAFLYAQLELMDEIRLRRKAIYEGYYRPLLRLEQEGLLRLPHIPTDCDSNFHMFYIVLPAKAQRDALMDYLRQNGIQAVFHYIPLHSSPMGRTFGYRDSDLPITEAFSGRLLRLPLYYGLTEGQQAYVVQSVTSFLTSSDTPRLPQPVLASSGT